MKIAVSSSEEGLNGDVYPLFGRCSSFTFLDVEEGKIIKAETRDNPGYQTGGGAGITAAQTIIDAGADAVITGNCGPKALSVLLQAGIKVYAFNGRIEDGVKELIEGKLSTISSPSRSSHFGIGFGMKGGFGGGRR